MVERPDGFKFRVNVTLPPDYKDGHAELPAIFWFYPREFATQEAYDRGSARSTRTRSRTSARGRCSSSSALGYAVVEPDAPIVGPGGPDEQQLRARPAQQPGGR